MKIYQAFQRTYVKNNATLVKKNLKIMPTHIPTHLQFAQADPRAKNCKRVEILPTHKDRIV